MTTEDALLRAILENPAEDTPRLAYADHLDETPTPKRKARADLIRKQITTSNMTHGQEDAILRKWGAGWLPTFERKREYGYLTVLGGIVQAAPYYRGYVSDHETAFRFERGFISRARIVAPHPDFDAASFGKIARALLTAHPIEMLTLAVDEHDPSIVLKIRNIGEDWWINTEIGVERIGYGIHTSPRPSRKELLQAIQEEVDRIVAFTNFVARPPF